MPNRDKVVADLAGDTTGERHWWNVGTYPPKHHCPEPGTDLAAGQCGLPADRHEAAQALAEAKAKADALYVRIVDVIDWQRVLSTASARHHALQRDDEEHRTGPASMEADEVCGDCIKYAVLSTERFQHGYHGGKERDDSKPRSAEDFLR